MTYVFDGILVSGGEAADREAARTMLGPRVAAFREPFAGFGVAFAADHELEAFAAMEELHEGPTPNPATSPAVAFSAARPGLGVTHVRVECWGGGCNQSGFAARAGRVVAQEAEGEDQGVSSPLMRLFKALDTPMASGWHRALERGFFPPPSGRGD